MKHVSFIILLTLSLSPQSVFATDLTRVTAIQQATIEKLKKDLDALTKALQTQQDGVRASTFSWSDSNAANSASLAPVFNQMRDRHPPGIYTCFARTNNGAHFKGFGFDLALNYYNRSTDYPHLIKNVREINAATSGCSGTFSLSASGTYSLAPGNCFESLMLVCKSAL